MKFVKGAVSFHFNCKADDDLHAIVAALNNKASAMNH